MFRLEERQLHILIGLLCGASLILFCLFGIGRLPEKREPGIIEGMGDFSEGWVAVYETEDTEKLQQYRSTQEGAGSKESSMITEVVNFPDAFKVKNKKSLTLSHKIPDLDQSMVYLAIQTDNQAVRAFAGEDLVYSSLNAERRFPVSHVIPIDPQYSGMAVTIELTGYAKNQIEIEKIQIGSYTEVLVEIFRENGEFFAVGILLLGISICMLTVWFLAKKTWKKKRLLLYCILEGFALGFLLCLESSFAKFLIGWNYGVYFIQTCLIVFAAICHLIVIRSFVYRRKMVFAVDIGITAYGIFYISVMVLQAFFLMRFDDIYFLGKIFFVLGIILYTALLGVAIYMYKQREGITVFYANITVLVCLLIKMMVWIFVRQENVGRLYIPAGIFIYMLAVWICGWKQIFHTEQEKDTIGYGDEAVREQVMEQLNPNLLFASFKTLQNLIKNGSDKSVKMIYYISVYFRGNLKAVNLAGEMIPFEEELEHMIAYLQMQKTRNSELDFAIECKIKDFNVPRHSIEPMVENAVKYGVANNGNRGNVVIRTYQREEGYAIQVVDDGAGFDRNKLTRKSPTALLNLFAMLEKTCQAKFEMISKEGKGTVITIILPVLENDLPRTE